MYVQCPRRSRHRAPRAVGIQTYHSTRLHRNTACAVTIAAGCFCLSPADQRFPPHDHSLAIAAYLAFFAFAGFVFLFAILVSATCAQISERRKSSKFTNVASRQSQFVQFDLRFHVVALLFIIFDAPRLHLLSLGHGVLGKATQLMDRNLADRRAIVGKDGIVLTPAAAGLYRELGVENPTVP